MPNQKKPRLASVSTLVRLAEQGEAGRFWYDEAREQVDRGSVLLNIAPRRFADLLALFSPRVAVKRSIRFAVRYAETGEYAADVMRSVRASVDHYEQTGEIRGPKTRPFADALRGDGSAIVLDVWMAVAFGVDQRAFNRVGVHAECTRRIRIAAKRLGWTPAETQAAMWYATVRNAGRSPGRLHIVRDSLFGAELEIAA